MTLEGSVKFDTIFPATINSAIAVQNASEAAAQLAGTANVDAESEPKLFSEDFAHMAAAKPGCFILTGNGTDGSHGRPLHSADYDFNDETLKWGSSFWVELVEQQLA